MPIRSNDHAQAIEDQGFKLLYNPPGGGNCTRQREWRETISKEIVEHLKSNPFE